MAATIWYASQPDMRAKPGIRELADFFCQEMEDHLRGSASTTGNQRPGKDSTVYRLSKSIMNGDYAWLEEGIVPIIEK
jgi:hypothetical protein